MLKFEFAQQDREALCAHHRQFQSAVSSRANEIMGSTRTAADESVRRIPGVFDTNGGVVVNRQQVLISHGRVSTRGGEATAEEKATVQALVEVNDQFKKLGAKAFESVSIVEHGDPLRRFFSAGPSAPPRVLA